MNGHIMDRQLTIAVLSTLIQPLTRTADTNLNGTYHFRSHNLSAESGTVKMFLLELVSKLP